MGSWDPSWGPGFGGPPGGVLSQNCPKSAGISQAPGSPDTKNGSKMTPFWGPQDPSWGGPLDRFLARLVCVQALFAKSPVRVPLKTMSPDPQI